MCGRGKRWQRWRCPLAQKCLGGRDPGTVGAWVRPERFSGLSVWPATVAALAGPGLWFTIWEVVLNGEMMIDKWRSEYILTRLDSVQLPFHLRDWTLWKTVLPVFYSFHFRRHGVDRLHRVHGGHRFGLALHLLVMFRQACGPAELVPYVARPNVVDAPSICFSWVKRRVSVSGDGLLLEEKWLMVRGKDRVWGQKGAVSRDMIAYRSFVCPLLQNNHHGHTQSKRTF